MPARAVTRTQRTISRWIFVLLDKDIRPVTSGGYRSYWNYVMFLFRGYLTSEILSRIARPTAALSRLKIIWRDKNISLASKVKLMRMLILSTFLYACESWTLTTEIERRIQDLEMRCYRRLLNISYKDHIDERGGSQKDPECNWSAWWSPNRGKETETQMVWPHLKVLWHGKDNSAGDSERRKKERKTEEEMGK